MQTEEEEEGEDRGSSQRSRVGKSGGEEAPGTLGDRIRTVIT